MSLRLLQTIGAGYDRIDFGAVPSQAAIGNCYGHEAAIGEYVLLGMLAWCHRLIPIQDSFRSGSWRMSSSSGAEYHEELAGKIVGIVGFGWIGKALARLAKAVGMKIAACTRSPIRPAAPARRLYRPLPAPRRGDARPHRSGRAGSPVVPRRHRQCRARAGDR